MRVKAPQDTDTRVPLPQEAAHRSIWSKINQTKQKSSFSSLSHLRTFSPLSPITTILLQTLPSFFTVARSSKPSKISSFLADLGQVLLFASSEASNLPFPTLQSVPSPSKTTTHPPTCYPFSHSLAIHLRLHLPKRQQGSSSTCPKTACLLATRLVRMDADLTTRRV